VQKKTKRKGSGGGAVCTFRPEGEREPLLQKGIHQGKKLDIQQVMEPWKNKKKEASTKKGEKAVGQLPFNIGR